MLFYKDYSERIWKYLFLFLPYALIYSIKVCNGVISALLGVAIVGLVINSEFKFDYAKFIFVSLIFSLSLLGIIYTSNLTNGLSFRDTRIPLLILPLIFGLRSLSKEIRIAFLQSYINSNLVTFFVFIVIALYKKFKDLDLYTWLNRWHYHYSDLTKPINIDPLYLSLFVGFGFLILLLENLGLTQNNYFEYKKSEYLFLIVFSFFLVILGTRSIQIIVIMVAVFLLIQRMRLDKKGNAKRIFFILSSIVFLALLSPATRERFKGLYTHSNTLFKIFCRQVYYLESGNRLCYCKSI
jgi:hypothetical protein